MGIFRFSGHFIYVYGPMKSEYMMTHENQGDGRAQERQSAT
jgi:hypothetical protein